MTQNLHSKTDQSEFTSVIFFHGLGS